MSCVRPDTMFTDTCGCMYVCICQYVHTPQWPADVCRVLVREKWDIYGTSFHHHLIGTRRTTTYNLMDGREAQHFECSSSIRCPIGGWTQPGRVLGKTVRTNAARDVRANLSLAFMAHLRRISCVAVSGIVEVKKITWQMNPIRKQQRDVSTRWLYNSTIVSDIGNKSTDMCIFTQFTPVLRVSSAWQWHSSQTESAT